jgi:hypothetical protein
MGRTRLLHGLYPGTYHVIPGIYHGQTRRFPWLSHGISLCPDPGTLPGRPSHSAKRSRGYLPNNKDRSPLARSSEAALKLVSFLLCNPNRYREVVEAASPLWEKVIWEWEIVPKVAVHRHIGGHLTLFESD